MTVHPYNLNLAKLIKLLILAIFCLYSQSNYAQPNSASNKTTLISQEESHPVDQNNPPAGTKNGGNNWPPCYENSPKSEICPKSCPVKTVSPQLIDNHFHDKENQQKYESKLFEYEMWRLDFLKIIHTDQYEMTKLYGNFLFFSLLIVFVLLISNTICGMYKGERDWVFFSIKDGKVILKMNTFLFVLIVILLYLYHYYFTIIYPIN